MNTGTRRDGVLWATLVVLLVTALVRIINIDGPALWTDEGFTYYTFTIDLWDALLGDRHPPFYFATLHLWQALAGDSILALRWWSLLPSMLTVALMAQIGRELLRHLRHDAAPAWMSLPVLAALAISLADGENYMAQELRMYTWHVCFAAWATLAYLRWLRLGTPREAALWGLAGTLLLYTHYFGAFVLMIHAAHALIALRGRRRWRALLTLAAMGLAFAPWFFGATLRQFADDAVCVNCATSQNIDILLDFRLKWFGQHWPLPLALTLLGGGLLLHRRRWGLFALLLGLLLLPVLVTFNLGHDEAVLLARRMVQISVPLALLLALGLAALRPLARGLVMAALLAYGVSTVDWYRVKVPWHRITDVIAAQAAPGELALMEVGFEQAALLYYYDHRLPKGVQISSYPVWSDRPRSDYYDGELLALLAEQPQRQSGVLTAWVTFFSPDPGLMQRLEAAGYIRTWTHTTEHVGSQIDVYRYDRLPDVPAARYANDLTLLAAEINADARRVYTWWVGPTESDYSISVGLLADSGVLVAQADGPPPMPTSHLTAPVYDGRVLQPVEGQDAIPPGTYQVIVKVYRWTPEAGLVDIPLKDGSPWAVVGSLTVSD